MTWPVIPGAPHGGPLPEVQVGSISPEQVYSGGTVTISGSGFTPGTQVILNPGNILVATSMPTVTDEITFTIPYGLPNQRHTITITNGASAVVENIYVIRDVFFSRGTGQEVDILIGELN